MLEIIKEYRLKADLTYPVLASKIGVEFQTLQSNLIGKNSPNERTAYKYAEFIRTHRSEIESTLGRSVEILS